MRFFFCFLAAAFFSACNNDKAASGSATFCDTACTTDTFQFAGTHRLKPFVSISVKNCTGDTITWSHNALEAGRQMHLGTLLDGLVRLNASAINCVFNDTSNAWVTFNDCSTGRGYLLKLPFDKKQSVNKMSSALNSFDKKFAVPDDLRAYADYSTIYVVDVKTGKQAQMTFKEEYKIDWKNIHQTIDSINVSRSRVFVRLLKDGQPVELEKQIAL